MVSMLKPSTELAVSSTTNNTGVKSVDTIALTTADQVKAWAK